MTIEEEIELHREIQSGDESAIRELVEANLNGLWPIARALANKGGKWEPSDLFQEGALAMVRFASRWEPRPGIPFAAACRQRVRGAMKDFLRRKADAVRNQRDQPLSLDAAGGDESGRTLGETLGDEAHEGEELALDLDGFSKNEQQVIKLRVLTQPPLAIVTVARRLGKKPATIKRIQLSATRKLMKMRQAVHA